MKPALCELVDQQNGTFLLRIRPMECGIHQLFVTFCGEPILGLHESLYTVNSFFILQK